LKRKAIIIGAGPAGLTAAFELLTRTDIQPIVIEKNSVMGGLSRTINYKGYRLDLGGHRFFSKSERVMEWWLNILPLQSIHAPTTTINYHHRSLSIPGNQSGPNPETTDQVMLLRDRRSRIFFSGKLFDYPINLNIETVLKLGPWTTFLMGLSYLRSVLFPIKNERNLEQFFINRFGRKLYRKFFKSYTEKVWGIACDHINASWGSQRIKGLSVAGALSHFFWKLVPASLNVRRTKIETTLVDRFLYPKFGPGQMWDTVAKRIIEKGGVILTDRSVNKISMTEQGLIKEIATAGPKGKVEHFSGDYYFSSMPVQELIKAVEPAVPSNIRSIGDGLIYRDFLIVGLLLKKLNAVEVTKSNKTAVKDNWIYIQEPEFLVGRLQIFNNWSPYMVADPSKTWVGMEYFCNETDSLWKKTDSELIQLATQELSKMGMIDPADVLDATVCRQLKTYPAYFGSYDRFNEIREYLDKIENLFLIGRNGMHQYNNQDHSMLTAMTAVDNILENRKDRSNLWAVNTEDGSAKPQ
jgi:protoporphyrinogen oxidase